MKIAARIARMFVSVGKYFGLLYIDISSCVVLAQRIPRGTARIRRKYSIISFLSWDAL